ncbi:MAG: DUF4139 domain-containing protein [Myxococcales bacterium]|nr:DUF4139 domain-containing protein [Myxococcales bacterium]
MRLPVSTAATLALIASAAACTPHTSYVQTDNATLGRVVVYRNGIAYYERRATTQGDKLSLRVPADKIDDFLKSLTVADAKTGEPVPVSFPSRSVVAGGHVDMAIQLPDKAHRDLVLTYVTEAPAWKPSYRVVLGDDGKVSLQGWAVVDNTSGEDWRAVKIGVGSSSALSFRYDLHSIRVVHRETLRTQDSFAKAPPLGGTLLGGDEGKDVVLAQLEDLDIPRPVGHPDVASARRDPRLDEERVKNLSESLKKNNANLVIEGYADVGESEGDDKARDRANLLRNQLIERGVAPGKLSIAVRAPVAGQKAGVRVVETKLPPQSGSGKPDEDNAMPVGESHFESTTAMTVEKGTSAMVSVMQGTATGDVVYLYDAEGRNGDTRYAFRSVRFRNPTTSTLESGPVTVYATGRFVGEGLTQPVPPGATAVVPFGLDRQVVVDRDDKGGDRMSKLVKLNRGVLTCEVQHLKATHLRITNRLHTAATLLIRHSVRKGWELTKSPKVVERLGEARLFAVEMGPGETKSIEIEEATPMQRTVDLRSAVGIDLVKVWLQTAQADAEIAASVGRVLELHGEMARHEESIVSLRERGNEFRTRADELQRQIFELKLIRTTGSLMTHLQSKMKETSQKLQDNTVAIVNAQEKLMMSKVKFHDQLSDLRLDHRAAAKVETGRRPGV